MISKNIPVMDPTLRLPMVSRSGILSIGFGVLDPDHGPLVAVKDVIELLIIHVGKTAVWKAVRNLGLDFFLTTVDNPVNAPFGTKNFFDIADDMDKYFGGVLPGMNSLADLRKDFEKVLVISFHYRSSS
jgi:hypothetical protein